jgi:type IV secretion system protein VirB4
VEVLTELLREHPTPEDPNSWLPEFHARRKGLRSNRAAAFASGKEFLRHAPTELVPGEV